MQTILRMFLGLMICCAVARAQPITARSDAQDIVELQAQKKIAVKARGAGIESVSLELRRLGSTDLTVRIPVGTFFVA